MRNIPCFLVLLALFAPIPTEAHPRGYLQKLQNDAADRYDLSRLETLDDLRAFVDAGRLVSVGDTDAYAIDQTLAEMDPEHRDLYRHARPWTKAFLDHELGAAHDAFGTRYVITSLVRTQAYQRRLCHSNGNAICGASGWKRSSHLTGATVDISRIGLSRKEDAWIRRRLNTLASQGKVIYIQEYGQYCFHVMVLPSYAKAGKVRPAAQHARRHRKRRRSRHR